MSPFAELPELLKEDFALRKKLLVDGKLFGGYNSEMEALHNRNGAILERLLSEHGWPNLERDGEAIQQAAWYIVMHSISMPPLQRMVLGLLMSDSHGLPPTHIAMLEDRVLIYSGKRQLYGTQMDMNAEGVLIPSPIEDEDHVDERRAVVGFPRLASALAQAREKEQHEGEVVNYDFADYWKGRFAWMLRVGWIGDLSEVDQAYFNHAGLEPVRLNALGLS